MENRHDLVIGVWTRPAASEVERGSGLELLAELPGTPHKTVGGDKGGDTQGFVAGRRELKVTHRL